MGFRVLSSRDGNRLRDYQSSVDAGINPITVPLADMAAWWDSDVAYITKDGSDYVSQWDDRSGNGVNLVQATGTNQPQWSANGVTFDGSNDFMYASGLSLSQPCTFYLAYKPISWTYGDDIFLEGNDTSPELACNPNSTPQISLDNGGGGFTDPVAPVVGNVSIIAIIMNGASNSWIRLNDDSEVTTGNWGTQGFTGFKLGGSGGSPANMLVKEIIFYSAAHSTATETIVRNYLNSRYPAF